MTLKSTHSSAGITIGDPVEIVPGKGALPHDARPLKANNNLDIASHGRRLWLAWRTAPSHFASSETQMHVVSSDDLGKTWRYETTIAQGRDIREPRFLSWHGDLFIYWFEAGTNPAKFEPGEIFVSTLTGAGWSDPEPISAPGYVVWRPRVIAGRALMSVYSGGETIFSMHPEPTKVELWESDDGIDWHPLDPNRPVVHTGGTETDFVESPDGGLLAVTRKEGPAGGWGTDICISDERNWSSWRHESNPRKLDSPLMFACGKRFFVIARRQLANRGRYDLGLSVIPDVAKTRLYQGIWWLTRKRTALFEVDPEALSLEWVVDLPSRGDTAFAGLVETGPGEFLVYNYSSPLDQRDRIWLDGQLNETRIYATTLTIET